MARAVQRKPKNAVPPPKSTIKKGKVQAQLPPTAVNVVKSVGKKGKAPKILKPQVATAEDSDEEVAAVPEVVQVSAGKLKHSPQKKTKLVLSVSKPSLDKKGKNGKEVEAASSDDDGDDSGAEDENEAGYFDFEDAEGEEGFVFEDSDGEEGFFFEDEDELEGEGESESDELEADEAIEKVLAAKKKPAEKTEKREEKEKKPKDAVKRARKESPVKETSVEASAVDEEERRRLEERDARSLVLKLHGKQIRATVSKIKALHPDILNVLILGKIAILQFVSEKIALAALKVLQNSRLLNHPLNVERSKANSTRPKKDLGPICSTELTVTSLPADLNKEAIQVIFPQATSITLKHTKNIAFLEFDNAADAKNAFERGSSLKIWGIPVLVQYKRNLMFQFSQLYQDQITEVLGNNGTILELPKSADAKGASDEPPKKRKRTQKHKAQD